MARAITRIATRSEIADWPIIISFAHGLIAETSVGQQLSELPDGHNPRWHEVRDDERGREKEQAEDEVPDEAVTLSASNTCGPERDCDPNERRVANSASYFARP